ncbi:pyridoxamine 5'-phosphate oxidase family protein [Polaribacter litorisediminis]|uniref:pyridoxamine 5'-phosphate oxidase family protein n=1 Tax=Polaribacter litorisediminis TaxID=1908341 RepID=UPI001CBC2B6A|nr:pyridoxamine 5'-phosphate oxidase family protein [Polaribacter litorisediminis]UAM98563.1 pyridoxamine 5'-phosphate oxidase family protein [Polaribacter litorisediminis]
MKYLFVLFFVFLFASCDTAPKPIKKGIKEIAKEIMRDAKNCALITIDSVGIAHARTMDPFLPEEDFTVWMGTKPKSLKVQQIQKNKNVTLYYFDTKTGSYVTLQGTANSVNSEMEKEKYWKTAWKNFYKNKTTDYLLIKFTPKKATIISEKYSILGDTITWKAPQLNLN